MRCAALLLAAALSGCSAVKMSRVRDDYEKVDQTRTKRLVVLTAPLPEGQQNVGELWGLIAQRHVNLRRNFLAKQRKTAAEKPQDLKSHCGEGIEGVLWLEPNVRREGAGVSAEVNAQLARCTDGAEVGAAQAGGSWQSDDPVLADTAAQYATQLGEGVRPYVAPSFLLLKATLDTLPNPVLNDEDVSEKIELEE